MLQLDGLVDDESRTFTIAITEAAHAKHRLQVGDALSGAGEPVVDTRTETAELYKISKLEVLNRTEDAIATNVSSLSGVLPGGGSYGVSKHAVLVLTESLYQDLAESAPHVKVSALCPGWVATEFYRVDQSRPERFKGETTEVTDEHRETWRGWLTAGITTDQLAQILFDGLARDQLYIGVQGFRETGQDVGEKVMARAQNIVQEKNPPSSSS